MEVTTSELCAVGDAAAEGDGLAIKELSELQLALAAGGNAGVIIA